MGSQADVAKWRSPKFTRAIYCRYVWHTTGFATTSGWVTRVTKPGFPKSIGRSAELSHDRRSSLSSRVCLCWFIRVYVYVYYGNWAPFSRIVPFTHIRWTRVERLRYAGSGESWERRSVPDRRSLRMVSDGCRQDREVLQSGLHRLVNRPIALVGAVAVGGAQSLQLRQVTVKVLVAYLLLRSARGVRYSHLLQQSDHVVT